MSSFSPAFAPNGNFTNQTAPPPPPPPSVLGNITYINNQVSDNQIVTALWVSVIVGAVALGSFSLLRSHVKTFHTRLLLGSVWVSPPDLPIGGINHLWSWMFPVFKTSDAELIHTAGLDALILSWILSLGIQIFFPVSILGGVMLLPICLTGDRVAQNQNSQDPRAAASTFSKLTVSNIARGSGAYWVVFAFVYIVTIYICWLLVKYYQAYVILRQHYLMGGENLINEWHLQYLAQKEAAAERASSVISPRTGPLSALRNLFDPSSQVGGYAEDMEATSLDSGHPLRHYAASATHSLGRRVFGSRDALSMASGQRSQRQGRLASALRRRRMGRSPSPSRPHDASIGSQAATPMAAAGAASKPGQLRVWISGEDHNGETDGSNKMQPPPPQEISHRREGSELTREVLAAAGLAPSHDDKPPATVYHESGVINPGAGGLRSTLKERSNKHAKASDTGADEEQHVKGRSRRSSRFLGTKLSRGAYRKGPGMESTELIHRELQRSTSLKEDEDCGPGGISKYEQNPPPDEGRERILHWWQAAEWKGPLGPDAVQASKPNVSFRKIVNTTLPEGEQLGVNAQCYAILVTDVPDLRRERRKAVKRAARRRWWWRLWYRFAAWFKVRVMLRKNVDRRTGDFVLPPTASRPMPLNTQPGAKHEGAGNGSVELSAIRLEGPARTGSGGASLQVWPVSEGGEKPAEQNGQERQSEELDRQPAPSPAVSPRSDDTVHVLDDEEAEHDSGGEEEIDSELIVRQFFKAMFPDSFDGVLPIRRHKEVDILLAEWNQAWHKLKAAEATYVKSGRTKRPQGKPDCCGCSGERVDLIDHWASEIRRLEAAIVEARHAALASRSRTSFFVFFTSQRDAAIAAQTNLTPEDGHTFRVHEAPGPEEVNWQTLWMTRRARDIRGLVVLLPLAVLMIFPIGLFSGAVNQATVAICNGNSFLNVFYSDWYCQRSSLARSLVTGILPSILLMLWQNLVMPSAVYRITQQEGACFSLSQLDRRIGVIFFIWDIFNVLLGAMLGGSIFSQLGTVIKNPGSIASSIGTALPAASNFFINFIILQALATQTVRMLIPHLGVIPEFFRLCGLCKPTSELARAEALSPHSIRYGREIGAILLVYLEAMAYAATSPIILPFALLYFCFSWVHWRYNILYISERCYESGGRAWDMTFQCMVWVLFIFELFTGFVLLANSAYAQATIMWLTITPLLYKFANYCETRYGAAVRHMPLETAAVAPSASVPAVVYMPPALRKGAAGWYPEFGKAWENFGMPTYTW